MVPEKIVSVGRILKWAALAAAAVLVCAVGGCLYQVTRPARTNAWYVALGSSYAAGPGLGPLAPGSPFVSQRTVNGYPEQLARILKAPSFANMTSSGSTIEQVLHGGQWMLGPQIDVLGPDTRLVTLTAGGNDIGYVGDLAAMAYRNHGGLLGAVAAAQWRGRTAASQQGFAALGRTFQATLRAIHLRAPLAQIVVVTYPAILPESGTCPPLAITSPQADRLRRVAALLAQATREAAAKVGATLVDMALPKGHDVCSARPWVNGFHPRTGADFHPNFAGAHATAEAIENSLERR